MTAHTHSTTAVVIGGGVVGAAIAFTLAHRGVEVTLLEAEPGLGYGASGTNSGVLHTGFDSTPGELETELILRAAKIRPAVIEALGIPVLRTGALLMPHAESDHETIAALAENARRNGVEVSVRESDGALEIPGEWVSNPVLFTLSLAASAAAAGAQILSDAKVTAIAATPGADGASSGIEVTTADGRRIRGEVAINAAGLHADDVARLVGDDGFEIFPRKGEFFVFEPGEGAQLGEILLPVPTKRTKGVLVFPTLDGKVVAGPTAHDQEDKDDWSVRPEAADDVLPKAVAQYPALAGLTPIARYSGLRPAGRGTNYVIGRSPVEPRLINVAAIRSTGLSASLGIGAYVADLLAEGGIELGETREPQRGVLPELDPEWWRRTADRYAAQERR